MSAFSGFRSLDINRIVRNTMLSGKHRVAIDQQRKTPGAFAPGVLDCLALVSRSGALGAVPE
jgi:hypothetical protein